MSSTNAIVAKTESVDSVWTSLKDALENIGLHPSIIDDKGNINFDKKIPKDIILGFNTEQCVQFAEHNKLTELKKIIEENGIDGKELIALTTEDLESFKMTPFQIKRTINTLKEYQTLPPEYYRTPAQPGEPIIDKEVPILVGGKTIKLFQHTATALYISLSNVSQNDNFSSYIVPQRKPWGASDTDVYTRFSKIRFDPTTMTVHTGDYTFAKSVGNCGHHKNEGITTSFPYATAFDCESNSSHSGKGNINLLGTPFAVADEFKHDGWNSNGTWEFLHNNQVVNLTGGGYCGWTTPANSGNESTAIKGGWYLKLKVI